MGVILILATFGLLAFHARSVKFTKPGTSEEYWEYLCGVQLPGFKGHERYSNFGSALPVIDGKAFYYAQLIHGWSLYSVPVDEVLRDLPAVQDHLKNPRPPSSTDSGYDSLGAIYKENADRRFACANYRGAVKVNAFGAPELEALRLAVAKAVAFRQYDGSDDSEFRDRLGRTKRAWATYAFEGFYLAAWLMFVFGLPPLRVRWYWRVACAPFLLYLPFFLGYAPLTFTFGLSGGFVYPIYLELASLPIGIIPRSALDDFVWEFLPKILSSLSQISGSPMATPIGGVGPVSSLAFGLLLLAGISGVIYLGRRFKPPLQRTVR